MPKAQHGPLPPLAECVMTSVRRGRPPGRRVGQRIERQSRNTDRYRPVDGAMATFEVLSLAEFMRRFRLSPAHIRAMHTRGMVFRTDGRYTRVYGQDYADYLQSQPIRGPGKTRIFPDGTSPKIKGSGGADSENTSLPNGNQ